MQYPKIDTIWKRDENNKYRIIEGVYSKEEFMNIQKWLVTEKIDGTNIRIIFNGETVEFRGRTDKAEIPKFLLLYLQSKFTIELLKSVFPEAQPITHPVVLFGEGYGGRIQKVGKKYREESAFILFDVWVNGWWLNNDSLNNIAMQLGIPRVPIIGIMTAREAIEYVKSYPKSEAAREDLSGEGIVARSHPLVLFRNGDPLMWKLKSKDYTQLEADKSSGSVPKERT